LGIIYYANGQELASDRGYIWDDPRNAWTSSTMAHNLVAVDGENQNEPDRRSRLELFGAGAGVEVIEASAWAYRQCSLYQRTCALVELPGGGTYAVDFFRVKGGKIHQSCFHANGSLIRTSAPASQSVSREHRWLGNFREAEPAVPFTATWETGGTRLDWMLLSPADRLLVADAPGWRSDAGNELNAPPIQQILAERAGETDNTASQFAAVIAPYTGDVSPIRSARLIVSDPQTGAMGIEVKLNGRTDTIVSALDQESRDLGAVRLAGRFGFVAVGDDGRVERAFLLGGTRLSQGDTEIRLPAAEIVLKVASTADRTYHLAEALPNGFDAVGRYFLAGETGFEIESATRDTLVTRSYPAIDCPVVRILNSAAIPLDR
jgi:hypothetical protein